MQFPKFHIFGTIFIFDLILTCLMLFFLIFVYWASGSIPVDFIYQLWFLTKSGAGEDLFDLLRSYHTVPGTALY